MRTIKFLVQKEFLQIFRNKGMLPIIFVMPVIQLLILSNAATFDIRNVTYHLIDKDQTTTSRRLAEKFTATGYFILKDATFSVDAGQQDLKSNRVNMVLEIPQFFERDLGKTGASKVQLTINAEDGNSAGLIQSYSAGILTNFAQEITEKKFSTGSTPPSQIHIEYAYWYNPELDYKTYMIPGILVALVTMIGLFLSGMNIVREKEIGTIEQLNVTPIKKYQFIVGKLLPFWIIGLFELAFGLLIGRLVFALPIAGSFSLIFGAAAVYLLVVLGIGLFISTVTETQQQAMFIAWFFMVIFLLMGGLFTPIESMPMWAQRITLFNPVAHYVMMMRSILLKGSGLADLYWRVAALAGFAVVMLTLAVLRYRKVSD